MYNIQSYILVISQCARCEIILTEKSEHRIIALMRWNCFHFVSNFIQYFARNRPWYSLRGLYIRITWFSLYGIRIPLFPFYGIYICPYFLIWRYYRLCWVLRCYGMLWTLHCHKDRYCDVTMIWSLLFHGLRADVSETPDNALTSRMHGDHTVNR